MTSICTLRRRVAKIEGERSPHKLMPPPDDGPWRILRERMPAIDPQGHYEPSPRYSHAIVWVQDSPGISFEQQVVALDERIKANVCTPEDLANLQAMRAECAEGTEPADHIAAMARICRMLLMDL